MSGPKVLRTVTREERIELGLIQIAMIEEAIKRWRPEVTDTDVDAISREEHILAKKTQIEGLLAVDRFDEVASLSGALVASVNQDIDRMREEQYIRHAKALSRERSLRYTARSVLERCHQVGVSIPHNRSDVLQKAADGEPTNFREVADIATGLLDVFAERETKEAADGRASLAVSLAGPHCDLSASELLATMEAEMKDPRLGIADKQIAELAKLEERQAAESFERRLADIVFGSVGCDPAKGSLALDALGVELAQAVKHTRQVAEVKQALAVEIAAATVTKDLEACRGTIVAAQQNIEKCQLDCAREQISKSREIRDACARARAAQAGRVAILRGLKQLGYEVREGMSTIWADKRRLVIRHPGKKGVALELAGNAELGRLQARMVAVQGAVRGSPSDREVELDWCSELKTLQDAVAKTGGSVEVENATPAGARPLKLVPDEWAEEQNAVSRQRAQGLKSSRVSEMP